jgi:lipoate-protein ligase A
MSDAHDVPADAEWTFEHPEPPRLISLDPVSEPMHHALDEVLLDRVAAGESPPIFRFWERETPAVAIGRFQAFEDEVDADYVAANDIPVVRRITGGGAMFCQPRKVITYSMVLTLDQIPDDVEESYAVLDAFAVDALRELGLEVRHEPLNDIAHDSGKVGGSAQLRAGDGVLHHTTMSYELDLREMLRTLRIGQDKLSDKAVASAEKRVTRIGDHIGASYGRVQDTLIDAWTARHGGESSVLTPEESAAAEELASRKFDSDEWNRSM